jgi:hypothetical protein
VVRENCAAHVMKQRSHTKSEMLGKNRRMGEGRERMAKQHSLIHPSVIHAVNMSELTIIGQALV